MKIAVCFYGKISKFNSKLKFLFQNHKRCIDDVDIFCHSWNSSEFGVNIDNILNPIKSIHEPQIDFTLPYLKTNVGWEERANNSHKLDYTFQFNQVSSAYSIKQVVTLKKDYEKEKDFLYDMVILTRYDISIDPLISSLPDLDSYVYFERYKNNIDGRIKDHIFISNSFNIDQYSELYDKLNSYRNLRSNYKKTKYYLTMDPHIFKRYHINTFSKHKAITDIIPNFKTTLYR